MRGYHCTFYSNLDSILENGIEPRNTMKNNHPYAVDNRYNTGVFFMTDIESSRYWNKVHHRYIRDDGSDSVIIEFEIDTEENYEDPYSWSSAPTPMNNARFVTRTIYPEQIIDIHEAA